MKISKDNYITMLGFMTMPIEEGGMGLSGNELIIYAVIFGFSQDGRTWFEGSQEYLASWCGSTTRTVRTALASLLKKGYIEKREKTVKNMSVCDYRVTEPVLQISGGWKNFPGGAEKFSDHINKDITPPEIDTNVSISSSPKGERHKYGEYQHVLLSDSELSKLKQTFPHNWEQKITELDEGIEQYGYKYKNHYLTILAWDRRDKDRRKTERKESVSREL